MAPPNPGRRKRESEEGQGSIPSTSSQQPRQEQQEGFKRRVSRRLSSLSEPLGDEEPSSPSTTTITATTSTTERRKEKSKLNAPTRERQRSFEEEDIKPPQPSSSSSSSSGDQSITNKLTDVVEAATTTPPAIAATTTKTTTKSGGPSPVILQSSTALSAPDSPPSPPSPSPTSSTSKQRSNVQPQGHSSNQTTLQPQSPSRLNTSIAATDTIDSNIPSETAATAAQQQPQEDISGDLSFNTADGSSGDADTSGSGMADHGHSGSSSRKEESSSERSRRSAISDSNGRRYLLHVLQQPSTGCAFGSNLLSRLAIAPPLIIHMQAIDRAGREISIEDELPFLVCHVHLSTDDGISADMLSPTNSPQRVRESGVEQATSLTPASRSVENPSSPPPSTPVAAAGSSSNTQISPRVTTASPPQSVRMLYGTLVASPMQLYTTNDRPATLFIFPEISIRSRGRFRLQISLMRVPLPSSSPRSTSTLATTSTDPFNVVLSTDYVAPHITDITRHFARQGVGLLLPPGQTGE